MKKDIKQLIKKYSGKWIAFNEDQDKVVAFGSNANTVVSRANKKGIKTPYLFKVPTKLIGYIGLNG